MMSEKINPQHIVVACTDRAGNVLLALPLFQTLRMAFPLAKITAWVRPEARPMVQGNPAIDHVESVEETEGIGVLAKRLKLLSADVFISVYPRPKLVLAAWRAGVLMRIGPQTKWLGFFQTHSVPIRREISDRNEVEYNFGLLRPLGVVQFAAKSGFFVQEKDALLAREFLREKGIAPEAPYMVVHPGAKKSTLNWKPEKYSQVLHQICQIPGLRVVVTGSKEEGPLLSQVTAFLFSLAPEKQPVLVTEELGLKPLAALYQGALCFLSGSTGPMHLAAAVGTPTVSLFSPAPEATPLRWGPWGNESTVIMPRNLKCAACQVGYCQKHDPMEAIDVSEVFSAAEKYIRRGLPR
jgi:heptosyltransferase-2